MHFLCKCRCGSNHNSVDLIECSYTRSQRLRDRSQHVYWCNQGGGASRAQATRKIHAQEHPWHRLSSYTQHHIPILILSHAMGHSHDIAQHAHQVQMHCSGNCCSTETPPPTSSLELCAPQQDQSQIGRDIHSIHSRTVDARQAEALRSLRGRKTGTISMLHSTVGSTL